MRKFKELGLKNKWLPKKNGKVYKYWLSILALIRRIRYKTKVTIAKSKYPKTLKWVLISAPAVIVLFVLGFIFIGRPNYNLSSEASLIVGNTNKRMLGELKYSSKTSSYVLNQTGINSAGSGVGSSRSIGGSESSGAYSASLPKDISKGITIYDDVSNLSFSMTPNMPLANAKRVDGHIVYPGKNGLQAVYTLLGNGLKEDLVLNHPSGNTASYSYTIKLPSYLQAKENGANAIGIYSADSALFGNISYGSSGSQQEVANARLKSPKTNLVFELLPPVVNQSNGKLDGTASEAKTTLKLKGNTIIVSVSGLAKLSYPVSIDPSVLVTSASFTTGNNEGDVNDTSGDLSEAGLDGGSVSAGWNYTEGSTNNGGTFVSGFTDARLGQAAVAYNGYLYVMGGTGPSSVGDCTAAYNTCNGVQYAAINSNGTVGTWAYTTSFAEARTGESAVAYNGYLYIIGGVSGTSAKDCTATGVLGPGSYNCNGVQYAQINSNGTVGTWNYTIGGSNNGSTFVSGFNQPRAFFSAVVYNGYLYIMGGESGSSANDCTAAGDFCSGVQDIIINANGTIDAWSYTSSGIQYGSSYSSGFTLARYGLSAVAYNGYLYVMGGLGASSNNDCTAAGTYCNGVQYAPIDSNGAIGTWAYTTSFTQARSGQSAVVYNGYLYIMGGESGSSANDCTATSDYCNGVQYAPINSNGTIGTWEYTASFTQARYDQSAAVYNGYLYIMGGRSGTSANDCTSADPYGAYLCNGSQYVLINPAGVISQWSATTSLLSTDDATSVAYNGYIYEIGGYTTAATATVDYAQIDSGGVLGSWTATTSLPTATYQATSVVYNGYIYEIGGNTTGGFTATVDYAQIDSGGALGSWTATTSLPTATADANSVVYNGYIYEIGGNGAPLAVDYAQIGSGGALVNTIASCPSGWTLYSSTWCYNTDSLISNEENATSVVANGYIYEIGGRVISVIQYAPINNNGSIGSWTDNPTDLPASTYDATSVVYNGYVYVIGGYTTTYSLAIDYAPINTNGTLGSWTATTSLPTATEEATSVVYNGYVYEVGGYNSSGVSGTVDYAQINNGGPGTIASWNTDSSNPLPQALYGSATAVYNGYIYILGGYNSSGPINYVYYAPISNAGVIGAWTSDTSLSTGAFTNARAGLGVAVYNGYLYIVGGAQPSTQQSVTYSTAGSGNWIAPAGVTSVEVQAWGGGGGGGSAVVNAAGGGGGGGEYAAEPSLAVTPGNSYAYTVGAGGSVSTDATGGTGGNSTFTASTTVTADGGIGGSETAGGGAGGTGSTNTVHYGGGAGGSGYQHLSPCGGCAGGGGGGSGGTSSAGNVGTTASNGVGGAGATAVTGGGPGGNGTSSTGGVPSSGPGGGGGGSGSSATGGGGYAGQITITWTPTTDLNDVQYAALNSNGSLSAPSTCAGGLASGNSIWCEATAFTTARTGLSTAVYNGNLYILGGQASSSTGGCTSTGDYCNDVQYDSINANGSLGGTWTDDTSLSSGAFSTARSNLAATAYDGYLYIMGGTSVASQDLSYTGSSVNFTVPNGVTSLTVDMAGASGGTSGGQSSTAGLGGRIQGNISVTPGEVLNIYVGGAGGNSSTSAGAGGYGYGTGGAGGADGSTYASAGAGGGGASAILNGATPLSIAGGGGGSDGDEYDGGAGGGTSGTAGQSSPNSGGGGTQSAVGGGGTAGTCTSGCAAGSGGSGNNGGAGGKGGTPGLAAANGGGGGGGGYYGGGGGGGGSTSNGGAGGGGSSLVPSGDSTTAGYQSGNGYVNISYVTADNDVQYAAIASNGSLSEPSSCNALASGNSIWCTSTSLPTARQGLSAVAYNGYMYITGGQASSSFADCTATSDYCNGVYYAPINNNGSIGAWTPTTSISTATAYASSAIYDGYVFYIGGDTAGGISSSVYYAGLDSIPRIGYYSILMDLSGSSSLDPTPTEIMAFGSNTGDPGIGGLSGPGTGGVYASYGLASNGCTIITSPSTLSTITELNTAYPINYLVSNACSNGSTNFRYVWVRYTLDDSQTASFPDVNGNHVTITGLSLYYEPAQADRLRGGATLTNGVQQPLYAPPVTGAP